MTGALPDGSSCSSPRSKDGYRAMPGAIHLYVQSRPEDDVVDVLGCAVVVVDRAGRIVTANRSVERITGFQLGEICGRFIWDALIAPHEIEDYKHQYDAIRG